MRAALIALLLVAACGQRETPAAPAETQTAAPRPELWFICDDLAGGDILVAARAPNDAIALTRLSRTGGEPFSEPLALGPQEGAAGSVYRALVRGGADAGAVRTLNPANLQDPGAAFTAPVVEVRLDGQAYDCRWRARTRVFAITDRRSVLITDDGDGDLIYQTFDFAGARTAQRIDWGGERSSVFSLELRGGEEETNAAGETFTFENQGYRYELRIPAHGGATLSVSLGGAPVQREAIRALITGPQS